MFVKNAFLKKIVKASLVRGTFDSSIWTISPLYFLHSILSFKFHYSAIYCRWNQWGTEPQTNSPISLFGLWGPKFDFYLLSLLFSFTENWQNESNLYNLGDERPPSVKALREVGNTFTYIILSKSEKTNSIHKFY